ncbi:MAG: hypothetical protein AAFZ92_11375 [Pseudomonadota bacterium]
MKAYSVLMDSTAKQQRLGITKEDVISTGGFQIFITKLAYFTTIDGAAILIAQLNSMQSVCMKLSYRRNLKSAYSGDSDHFIAGTEIKSYGRLVVR